MGSIRAPACWVNTQHNPEAALSIFSFCRGGNWDNKEFSTLAMVTLINWWEESQVTFKYFSSRSTTFNTTKTYCPNSTCFDDKRQPWWVHGVNDADSLPAYSGPPRLTLNVCSLFTLCDSGPTDSVCGSFTNTPAKKSHYNLAAVPSSSGPSILDNANFLPKRLQ